MEHKKLRTHLRLALSTIQVECANTQINYAAAQFSDQERQGMVAAYTEAAAALANILDAEAIEPALSKLLDSWFEKLYGHGNQETQSTPFEFGYAYGLRHSIGDMEGLLDE